MPRGWTRGPQGQMRPVGVSACAVHVMKVATGEIEENVEKPPPFSSRVMVARNGSPPAPADQPPVYGSGAPLPLD